MKRVLLAGAALAAFSTASYAADMPVAAPVEEALVAPVTWDGFFIGIQGGWAWTDIDVDTELNGGDWGDDSLEADDFVIGVYYGRNWQFDNWILGLDSSISYIGIDEGIDADSDIALDDVDVENNILGLSRLKVGYAFDNFMIFAAGGLATTIFDVDVEDAGDQDDDDTFGFGWTVGAGVETKFSEHWSARVEYIYANIQDDVELELGPDDLDVDLDFQTHIVRGGVAYHF